MISIFFIVRTSLNNCILPRNYHTNNIINYIMFISKPHKVHTYVLHSKLLKDRVTGSLWLFKCSTTWCTTHLAHLSSSPNQKQHRWHIQKGLATLNFQMPIFQHLGCLWGMLYGYFYKICLQNYWWWAVTKCDFLGISTAKEK